MTSVAGTIFSIIFSTGIGTSTGTIICLSISTGLAISTVLYTIFST
jgi:hypothetical protein